MDVVINRRYGGFGISDAAYEKLIEWGVPVQKYIEQKRDKETGLWLPESANESKVIFDRSLTLLGENDLNDLFYKYPGTTDRYWETWLDGERTNPLLIRAIRELGEAANGGHATLVIVSIPDDVDYTIEEYDGVEWIAEAHRTWRD